MNVSAWPIQPRLAAFYFFYFTLLGIMVPYLPLYLQHLGYGAVEIGTATAVLVATKIIAPNVWGWLADRAGTRMPIIRLGCLLAIVGFCCIYFQSNYTFLLLAIIGYSFFWNAVLAQFEAVTMDYLGEAKAARYSRIRLWGSLGFIVAVACCGWLFQRYSMSLFPPVVMVCLGFIFLVSFIIQDPPAQPKSLQTAGGNFWITLKNPLVLAFFFAVFCMVMSHGPYYSFFSVLMEEHHHSRSTIGLMWSAGVAAEVCLFWFMAKWLPAKGAKWWLVLCLLATTLRWCLVAAFPQYEWLMWASQLLHALSFAAFHAAAIDVVRRWYPHAAGTAQAFYSAVGYGAGNAIGSWVSGHLWDISHSLPFYLAAGCCFVAAVVLMCGVSRAQLEGSLPVNTSAR